jgi:hypothetical protein
VYVYTYIYTYISVYICGIGKLHIARLVAAAALQRGEVEGEGGNGGGRKVGHDVEFGIKDLSHVSKARHDVQFGIKDVDKYMPIDLEVCVRRGGWVVGCVSECCVSG